MQKIAIEALVYKYRAQMKDAVYILTNPANSASLEELNQAVDSWTVANQKLQTLMQLTGNQNGVEEKPEVS